MNQGAAKFTHALVIYGSFCRLSRASPGAVVDGGEAGLLLREVERRFAIAESVWGLIGPDARLLGFSEEGGFLGEWQRDAAENGTSHRHCLDWGDATRPVLIDQSAHPWAVWEGDHSIEPEEVTFRSTAVQLPNGSSIIISTPQVGGLDLKLMWPPRKPFYDMFPASAVLLVAGREIALGLPGNVIEPVTSPADEPTRQFKKRLESLFLSLRRDRIFGMDAYGGGWAPGEGWDIVAERVPETLRREWGWKDPAAFHLCWCDTGYSEEYDREELASELYSSNGLHQDYQDRVDHHVLPLPMPVTETCMYYDGPNNAARRKIAEQLVSNAPHAGLIASWNGRIESGITLAMPK